MKKLIKYDIKVFGAAVVFYIVSIDERQQKGGCSFKAKTGLTIVSDFLDTDEIGNYLCLGEDGRLPNLGLQVIDCNNNEDAIIYKDMAIASLAEWEANGGFDECKAERWKPKDGDKYWKVSSGEIDYDIAGSNCKRDEGCYLHGNVYKTDAEAIASANRQKAIVFINDLIKNDNDEWVYEEGFSYCAIERCCIGYVVNDFRAINTPLIMVKAKNDSILTSIIENHKDKLDLIFGVKK